MTAIRWAAAAATTLMSLMNLPIGPTADEAGIAPPLAWAISALGVMGLAAAVGLVRRTTWGRPAVLAVGAVNLVGAFVAVATGSAGGWIGVAVSTAILVLGALTAAPARERHAVTA